MFKEFFFFFEEKLYGEIYAETTKTLNDILRCFVVEATASIRRYFIIAIKANDMESRETQQK